MKQFFIYIIIAIGLSFVSCEEICTPIPPRVEAEAGRVIIIEELTGVECVPCAAAAAILEDIIVQANGAVVAYGVHGRFQSDPLPENKYDFRNPDAAELEGYLVEFGKPAAAINRSESSTGSFVWPTPGGWQAPVDAELSKPHIANVIISSIYNNATRRVDIEVDVNAIQDIEGVINLVVAISESDLIDAQDSPDGVIPDFKHKHVLREMVTTILGDPVAIAGLSAGEAIDTKRYSYTIPAENNGEWIPKNMEITAFITAEDRNGEVLQAAQIHIIE